MFTVVHFRGRKKLFYRYKKYLRQTKNLAYTEIVFSPPRNSHQKKLLSKILSEYSGTIVYEKSYPDNPLPAAPFPADAFCDRVLINSFYEYCKKIKPYCAVINPQGKIKDDFYLKLSNHVNRLVILFEKPNFELCQKILNYSGTPVFFDNSVSKDSICLDLSNPPLLNGGIYSAHFQKRCLYAVADSISFENECFDFLEPVSLSAALFEKFNRRDLIEVWSAAVNNLFI